MIKDELLKQALEEWGLVAQSDMCIEECAELIVAVRHWQRGRPNCLEELAEELADVSLMLEQMRLSFGDLMAKYEKIKLQRLLVLLTGEPKGDK